jgi:hypothetical protein
MSQLIERAVVKPLIWKHYPASNVGNEEWIGSGQPQFFSLITFNGKEYRSYEVGESFPTLEQAQAAAQENYASRILSQIVDDPSALTQPSPSPAAEGYVLVPVEPTTEMLSAGQREWNRTIATSLALIYRAMLSARPSIGEPVPGAGNGEVKP